MNRIEIASATPPEQAACLALLPEVRGLQPEMLIARRAGEIAGAAAICWANWNDPPGFPFSVHVMPGHRRNGVGRALFAGAVALARGETGALWSLRPVPVESEAAVFLRACGLVEQRRTLSFHMDMSRFNAHMARIVDRLRRHARISENARVVPLRDAPLDEVARIVSRGFARGPAQLLAMLHQGLRRGDDNGLDFDRSVVVLEGGAVAGALLYRWNGGHCLIEANVVAPAWRNTYVNALQLAAATHNAFTGGAASFQFDCDEDVTDSVNLARRNGGTLIATKALFRYALAS